MECFRLLHFHLFLCSVFDDEEKFRNLGVRIWHNGVDKFIVYPTRSICQSRIDSLASISGRLACDSGSSPKVRLHNLIDCPRLLFKCTIDNNPFLPFLEYFLIFMKKHILLPPLTLHVVLLRVVNFEHVAVIGIGIVHV